jgi:nitrite reductase/ring-hydroxylating ferredoxin subunit
MDEVAVGAFNDLTDGDYRIFAIEEMEVGIFRIGDRVIAYENVCPHAGGPVCQGRIFNRVEELLTPEKKSLGLRYSTRRNIVCPWHGYEFDIETGCHPGDRKIHLRPVKVDVRDGQIFVKLAS